MDLEVFSNVKSFKKKNFRLKTKSDRTDRKSNFVKIFLVSVWLERFKYAGRVLKSLSYSFNQNILMKSQSYNSMLNFFQLFSEFQSQDSF